MSVIPVINQFNQESVDEVFATSLIELVQVVRKSKEVQCEWEKVYQDRVSLIPETVKKWLLDYRNQIVFSESLGQGLSLPFVDTHTVQACLDFCDQLMASLSETQQDSKIIHTPTGIIAVIAGWNLQLREVLRRVVPALMAGNAVVVKVSSRSPSTGQMLMELSRYMSIIPGLQGFSSLIQIVYGADANQFLCTHPGIHAVSFVGQSKHFQSIIKMAMASNKKIQLSGSAKNCALLLKDFDFVQYGGDLLESIYTASNGLTWSTTRILALESERFRVIDFLRESMSKLRVTEMPDTSLPWTPGVVRSQAKSHDQMMNYLNQALDNGGYIIGTAAKDFELKSPTTKQKNELYTNERGAGFFIGVDVSQCAEIQHEPLQTPLVLVNFVKYQFDLAKWVNNSYLGLGASVWGGQEGFQKIADQLDVSYVRHNKWMPPCSARLLGRRQSVFGMTSLEVKGSFFSNVKVLD